MANSSCRTAEQRRATDSNRNGRGQPPPAAAMLKAFRDEMRARGYVEGQNLTIIVRWPRETFDQDPSPVADLVNGNVDLIVAWATPTVIAVRKATSTIPVVM